MGKSDEDGGMAKKSEMAGGTGGKADAAKVCGSGVGAKKSAKDDDVDKKYLTSHLFKCDNCVKRFTTTSSNI